MALARYPLRGKSSIKLLHLSLVNVGPVNIIAVVCQMFCSQSIYRNGRTTGRMARPGDQLNTRRLRLGFSPTTKNLLGRTEMRTQERKECQFEIRRILIQMDIEVWEEIWSRDVELKRRHMPEHDIKSVFFCLLTQSIFFPFILVPILCGVDSPFSLISSLTVFQPSLRTSSPPPFYFHSHRLPSYEVLLSLHNMPIPLQPPFLGFL